MSLFLLLIGLYLYFAGRIEFGTVRAEGRPVKAAGVILIVPGAVSFLLGNIFIPLAFGHNQSAIDFMMGLLSLLDLAGSIVAIALAYLLIVKPPNMPRLPGILGEIQGDVESGAQPPAQARPESPRPTIAPQEPPPEPGRSRTVTIPNPIAANCPQPSLNRDRFPAVMGLKDAARYLQTTEEEILKLIDDGKLVAARDNYNYQIAKSQLDELL